MQVHSTFFKERNIYKVERERPLDRSPGASGIIFARVGGCFNPVLLKTRTYLAAWRSLQVSFLAPCAHSYGKMICSNELGTHTHIIIIITDIVHSKDSLVSSHTSKSFCWRSTGCETGRNSLSSTHVYKYQVSGPFNKGMKKKKKKKQREGSFAPSRRRRKALSARWHLSPLYTIHQNGERGKKDVRFPDHSARLEIEGDVNGRYILEGRHFHGRLAVLSLPLGLRECATLWSICHARQPPIYRTWFWEQLKKRFA